ncbi:hypothetical protein LR48_Vigan03g063700 [Vigna angularis]|uniref:SWIM-type domain-containing protein n=1 Tax=Phaseolus angularis TaxID=3914 RepID=A0A0L9U3A3_PHAAN|nr:hypothetical protein LR48_Vigan03g063700 [Vigna angularis]
MFGGESRGGVSRRSLEGGSVLDDRLEALSDDRGAMHMMNLARLNGEVHLFVVHTVCEPEIIHMLENVRHNIGEEEVQPMMHDSDHGECEQVHDECQEVGDCECEVPVSEERGVGDDVVEGEIEAECDVGETERDDVVEVQLEVESDVGERERDDVVGGEIEVECDVDVRSWSCSGEDANVDCNVDVTSMDDLVDCDIQEEVGQGVENWFGEIEVDVEDDGPSQKSQTRISDSDVEDGINTENDRGLSDDNWESEELVSGGESDEEDALQLFEIRHVSQVGDKFIVDIDKVECTCRKWAISGIPCCHALAVMKFRNLDADDFIPVCFRKSTYQEIYSSIVYPVNCQNMWEITPYNDVLPPKKRILPGRPKKKRRLQEWELVKDETRMRKGGMHKRCGICKELGHNRTSCQKSTQDGELNLDQTQQSNPTNEENIPSSNQP